MGFVNYSFLFLLPFLFHFFDNTKLKLPLFYISSIYIFFVVCFRGTNTGDGDYGAYLRIYSLFDSWFAVLDPLTSHVEYGFRLISYLGNYFNFDGQFIFIVMGVLSLIPIYSIIKRYSPYLSLSLLLFVPSLFVFNMQASRVSVSVAIMLLAFYLIFEKKYIKSIILFIISLLFHASSVISLAIILVKLNIQKLFFLFLIMLFIGITFPPIPLIIKFVDLIGLDFFSYKLSVYFSSDNYGYPMKLYDPRFLFMTSIIIFIYRLRKNLHQGLLLYTCKLYIIGGIIAVSFFSNTILSIRLSHYFLISIVILLPLLLKSFYSIFKENKGYVYLMIPYYNITIALIFSFSANPHFFFWNSL